jgi:hypothetical protein
VQPELGRLDAELGRNELCQLPYRRTRQHFDLLVEQDVAQLLAARAREAPRVTRQVARSPERELRHDHDQREPAQRYGEQAQEAPGPRVVR